MADTEFSLEYKNKRYQQAERGLMAFANDLNKSPQLAVPILRTELYKYLKRIETALRKKHGSPWPATGSDSLSKRSGKSLESIGASIAVSGASINSVVGKIGGADHLSIHEDGGTVKAKNKSYLAIPLAAALDSNGVPKKTSPRDWTNTFVKRSKKGNLIIFQKVGTSLTPLYVLKKTVYIKPRLGMAKALAAGLPLFVDLTMDKIVKELLDA